MEWLSGNWKKVVGLLVSAGLVVTGVLKLTTCDPEKVQKAEDVLHKAGEVVNSEAAQ